MAEPIHATDDTRSYGAGVLIDRYRAEAAKRLGKSPGDLTVEELIRNSSLIYCTVFNRRYFNDRDNPRLTRTLPTAPIRLYHFTAADYLDSIKRDGLRLGDVPVSINDSNTIPTDSDFNNAVWLTSDIDPQKQGWSGATRDYRLTVQIAPNDPNLWRWHDLASVLRMSPEALRLLVGKGNKPNNWWVYVNQPIPPSMIVRYDALPSFGTAQQASSGISKIDLEKELMRQGLADAETLKSLGWV